MHEMHQFRDYDQAFRNNIRYSGSFLSLKEKKKKLGSCLEHLAVQ